jgi:hypothetical protein
MTTAEPKVVAKTITEVMKEKRIPPLRQKGRQGNWHPTPTYSANGKYQQAKDMETSSTQ